MQIAAWITHDGSDAKLHKEPVLKGKGSQTPGMVFSISIGEIQLIRKMYH